MASGTASDPRLSNEVPRQIEARMAEPIHLVEVRRNMAKEALAPAIAVRMVGRSQREISHALDSVILVLPHLAAGGCDESESGDREPHRFPLEWQSTQAETLEWQVAQL